MKNRISKYLGDKRRPGKDELDQRLQDAGLDASVSAHDVVHTDTGRSTSTVIRHGSGVSDDEILSRALPDDADFAVDFSISASDGFVDIESKLLAARRELMAKVQAPGVDRREASNVVAAFDQSMGRQLPAVIKEVLKVRGISEDSAAIVADISAKFLVSRLGEEPKP